MIYDSVVDAIGHTPLVRLRVPAPKGVAVYAKLELQNLFAMKDRVAKQAILDAKVSGELADGAPIVESSSGTMALGLAFVGAHLGHSVHIVTDPRIDPGTLAKLHALGCVVHIVEAMTGNGWQSARLERLAELRAELDGAFWPRQYSNPANPLAYRALADELRQDLGAFDILVGAVGSGGSLCGTSRALLPHLPDVRVVAVDAVGSMLFAQPDRPERRQSGLGNSLQPANLDHELIDEVHWLSDAEAFAATRRLAREQSLFAGNTSGSVYQVMCHLAAEAAPGTQLVGIFPDRGDRYVDTVYEETGGPVSPVPRRVRYGTPVASWSSAVINRRHRPVLVFVESNTTGTGMLALRVARRLGVRPVLLVQDPHRYRGLHDEAVQVRICDTNDDSALAAAVAEEGSDAPLAGITTTSEYYLAAVARLAERFRVPGNHEAAVRTCRDKAATRAVLDAAGVRQPRWAVVQTAADVPEAVSAVGLPCVVKPADDSGSNDVLLCANVEKTRSHAAAILASRYNVRGQAAAGIALVEAELTGPEVSVEVFSGAGRWECVAITRKLLTGRPYFTEYQHIFPADLPSGITAEVEATAMAAVRAAGLTLGAAHVEMRLNEAGPAIVEINARLAGGMIPEIIRLAGGPDLLEYQLRAAIGLSPAPQDTPARYAGIRFLLADRPGQLEKVHGVERAAKVLGVREVKVTAEPGIMVRPPRCAADRLGYVIAVGGSGEAVETALSDAATEIEVAIVDAAS
ncbi:pyridoxal-phosphate dependent enzyme [Nonomuraea insulae]|uniref:Pyridoxal-phosphate dependent enzyme n=1 Tax=Nonomuraea insulae TaxID=1616787 RepID=A0ABW1D8Z8_9ACTN